MKEEKKCELFVQMNMNRKERSYLSQLRYGILPIEVEVGRYRQKPLADHLCPFCVKEIEDERHFIFICPQYEDQRESIRPIGKAENITEDTALLHFLMNSKSRYVAKFVSSAFTRRGVMTAV